MGEWLDLCAGTARKTTGKINQSIARSCEVRVILCFDESNELLGLTAVGPIFGRRSKGREHRSATICIHISTGQNLVFEHELDVYTKYRQT